MQENWMYQHGRKLGVPVSVGVGGSFDVVSGLSAARSKVDAGLGIRVAVPGSSGTPAAVEAVFDREFEIHRHRPQAVNDRSDSLRTCARRSGRTGYDAPRFVQTRPHDVWQSRLRAKVGTGRHTGLAPAADSSRALPSLQEVAASRGDPFRFNGAEEHIGHGSEILRSGGATMRDHCAGRRAEVGRRFAPHPASSISQKEIGSNSSQGHTARCFAAYRWCGKQRCPNGSFPPST